MLVRTGRWCFAHRRVTLGIWLLSLVAVALLAGGIGGGYEGNPTSPDSESTDGFDLIDERFGGDGSGLSGSLVFQAEQGVADPQVRVTVERLLDDVREIDGVVSVTSPYDAVARQVSADGRVAYATINLDRNVDHSRSSDIGNEIERLIPDDGPRVEIGGEALAEFEPPESELIGLAFAIVVLIFAFGSVLAMGLPIGVALAGVGAGVALTTLLSNVMSVPDFATTIGAMIGLGVGIDYALFIVTRYREALDRGRAPETACAIAVDTAGRAVIFAGMTVVISLAGMLLMGVPFVAGLGVSAAITVALTMTASITLLPAFLAFAGHRVEVTRWRGLIAAGFVAVALLGLGLSVSPLLVGAPLAVVTVLAGFAVAPLRREVPRRRAKPVRQTFWYRWSRMVQAHPWRSAGAATLVLLLMAVPVLSLRLGFSDEGNYEPETTTRQAYDLLAEGFGPGFNGPLILAVDLGSSGPDDLARLRRALEADQGIAGVGPALPDDPAAPTAALIEVVPRTAPQDAETEDLVHRLRGTVVPEAVAGTDLDVDVTGMVPASIDFTDYLAGRLLVFFAVVLALSFLLLMAVFRSLLVPLKAVVMNMLSIAAAYGVVVAVFQWGWGQDLVGINGGGPIEPFIPMMLFAIVFGLSMDYEVFLLSRIKEEFDRTGDAANSVADGLASTARVITAAAAIMVVVFGSFVFEPGRVIKLFGMGLAVAIFLDATLVRMLLVPATMELLGDRNWWLPRWLDRILPRIDVEGHHDEPAPPASPEPERELVGV